MSERAKIKDVLGLGLILGLFGDNLPTNHDADRISAKTRGIYHDGLYVFRVQILS